MSAANFTPRLTQLLFSSFLQGTFSLIIEAWHENNETSGRTWKKYPKKQEKKPQIPFSPLKKWCTHLLQLINIQEGARPIWEKKRREGRNLFLFAVIGFQGKEEEYLDSDLNPNPPTQKKLYLLLCQQHRLSVILTLVNPFHTRKKTFF